MKKWPRLPEKNFPRALTLCEVTGTVGYLDQASRWVAVADEYYWDETGGGYFFTADDAPGLITRTKSAVDSAVPAGNGTMARVLARLYHMTGRDEYRRRAEAILKVFSGGLNDHFPGLATLLNAFETLVSARQVTVVGPPTDAGALRHAAFLTPVSDIIVMPKFEEDRPMISGKATAYVCDGAACAAPVTEVADLQKLLSRR
ncbi:MAG: hypothetical protein ABT940_07890 [Alphaproteobacteria bacterium]